MKSLSSSIACLFLLLLSSSPSSAQRINQWVGGTPGMERDWNCPKNWSLYQVPNQFSEVIIPDVSTQSQSMPFIRFGVSEVSSLTIAPEAVLEIGQEATLIVYDRMKKFHEGNFEGAGLIINWEEEISNRHYEHISQLHHKVNE